MASSAAQRLALAHLPSARPPKVLDRVREAIRTRHYSLRAEEAYVCWVRRFILFHTKRHPAEMGESEVNQFLTHLAVVQDVAASTQNQALAAILFLYKAVIGKDLDRVDGIVRAKKQKRLPVVLPRDEVERSLEECPASRSWPHCCSQLRLLPIRSRSFRTVCGGFRLQGAV